VLHLADHDPKGIDMTRDNHERLALYSKDDIDVRRIALNMDQVQQYAPPPNFAKETDTLFDAYVARFGTEECWELDALSPTVIAGLVRDEIETLIQWQKWNSAKTNERRARAMLDKAAQNWAKVENFLRGSKGARA
jgi:hypothetical protein